MSVDEVMNDLQYPTQEDPKPMGGCISRQAAIKALSDAGLLNYAATGDGNGMIHAINVIKGMPSVQPEIIRCKDCRWWDKYGDYDNGYCMAAKHGHWSEHWEICIRRKYKGDFYCADAERRTDE